MTPGPALEWPAADVLPLVETAPTPHKRRQVLLSAYACSPLWGSEPGVGWQWALELCKRHDVTVLTHAYFQQDIEAALRHKPQTALRFSYFRVPGLGGHPHRQLNSRLYYLAWQAAARGHVAQLIGQQRPDLIHHLTWGSYRLPCLLGGLGVPLAIGPVGGGEGAPARLYRSWPWRERVFYGLRALSITCSRWDPLVWYGMKHAVCVLTKTAETRRALPRWAQSKAFDAGETGIDAVLPEAAVQHRWLPPPLAAAPPVLQLLYAGRLQGGKGLPYLLAAMRLLQQRQAPVHLTVAGEGRLTQWALERVSRDALSPQVTMLGKVPREKMADLYDHSDLLAFPSWHDSSGNVVTEALARGLPVLCLDIGGPRYAVDAGCAVVVPTQGLDEAGLAIALAQQIEDLAHDRAQLGRLARGALVRGRHLTWAKQVQRAYDEIEKRLGWCSPGAPLPTTRTEGAQ